MSTRWFYSDNRATSWTEPSQATDTASVDFEYSAVITNPGNPTTNPSNWHNDGQENDI